MNSKKIKFANEYCFIAILDDADQLVQNGVVDYQILQNDLLIRTMNNEFARVSINSEEDASISELRSSYGRSLLRADKVDGNYISFTLMKFSDSVHYDQDNPLRIVVDQAISADLRKYNIEPEKAVDEVRRQLLVNEVGLYCFGYSRGDISGDLELIGDRFTFTISETPQHYLHITQMLSRSNRNRIDAPIVIIEGTVEIVNELTDRAILTSRANEQYSKMVSSDTEFIQLWNIYNELEMESIKQEATEMGFLKYKSFHYSNGMVIFNLRLIIVVSTPLNFGLKRIWIPQDRYRRMDICFQVYQDRLCRKKEENRLRKILFQINAYFRD